MGGSGLTPDGTENNFMKLVGHILMYKLCDLFNSLSTCALPSAWKCAIVMPLHEEGDHHDFNNYGPSKIYY